MSHYNITSSKLSEMMLELRTSYVGLWDRIVTDGKPAPDRMREVAKLDPEFGAQTQLNGVQLLQLLFEKRDAYQTLVLKPVAEPEPEPEPEDQIEQPKPEPEPVAPLIDQCPPTLEAEALERLRFVVEVNFSTIRGLVLLESDLGLWDRASPEAWLIQMRSEWESRLHSGWLDEFMEALELWVISTNTNTNVD
jgi:hypothetical protein